MQISGEAYDSLSNSGSTSGQKPLPPTEATAKTLAELVDDGTITSDQADTLKSVFDDLNADISSTIA